MLKATWAEEVASASDYETDAFVQHRSSRAEKNKYTTDLPVQYVC